MEGKRNKAYFAAGCFWGVEETFRKLEGVTATAVGYCGGRSEQPSYEEVCTGRTGHAETVEVAFDPARIGFEQLLEVFWQCHDPTQLNRQGPDVGTQYRSAIFCCDAAQQAAANASRAELETQGAFDRPIATEISPAAPFWKAEDYHQQYVEKHSRKRFGVF
jgi:peptide-methionine (S)-S-oxide reductase